MGQLSGPTDPTADAHWEHSHPARGSSPTRPSASVARPAKLRARSGTTIPQDGNLELLGSSYDNTGALGASTWRHVAFIEQGQERIEEARESGRALVSLGMPRIGPPPSQRRHHAIWRRPTPPRPTRLTSGG